MPILLLSMMGLLGLAVLFDGGDDAVDSDEAPDEMQPVEEDLPVDEPPSEALRIEGNAIVDEPPSEALRIEGNAIIATQGDDVVTGDMFAELEGYEALDPTSSLELDLLDGDDSFSNGSFAGDDCVVNGGDGSDTISVHSSFGTVNGDAGDDVLSSGLGSQLNGGAGDDEISFDTFDGSGDYAFSGVSGGAGDDSVQIEHELGWNNTYDTTSTRVTGGEGSDDFLLELIDLDELEGVTPEQIEFGGYVAQTSADIAQVYIEDFTPGEDTLVIDISSFTGGGAYELTDVALQEDPRLFHTREEGDNWYGLTLSLLAGGQTEPFEAVVHFRSAGGEVTLDDITILSGAAGATLSS